MSDTKKLPVAFLGTEFNNFLFASIGVDRIGCQLSVVSALARMDLDPWDEAEKLSYLSGDSATKRLITWMASFPELISNLDERNKTAKRLVELLPRRILGKARLARTDTVEKTAITARTMAAFFVIGLFLMFAGAIFMNLRIAAPQLLPHSGRPAAVSTPIASPAGS